MDFSVISAIPTILHLAESMQKPLIIGTTGLTKENLKAVEDTSKSIPILQASNTSFGVAVVAKLAQLAAQLLDETYDVEITEAHHRNKLDAPSGTALSLGKAVAKGRGHTFEALMADMDRAGRRQEGQIGFSVQRGGGIVGEHTIRFMGDDEIVEVSHKGLSRRLFARGAVKAALWLKEQPAGLYTMQNALGLA
jgi:4-hydroxy-tetrahydrodipicolinate reductase